MTNPLSKVDWEKLTPEEKTLVRNVEVWAGRVYSVETTINGLVSHLEQCSLEDAEVAKFRAYLEEIVAVVRMKRDEAVGDR
jgi:hypothetical protein